MAVASGVHRSITVPVTLDRLRFGNTKAGSESLLAQIEERQENHIFRMLLSVPLCFSYLGGDYFMMLCYVIFCRVSIAPSLIISPLHDAVLALVFTCSGVVSHCV